MAFSRRRWRRSEALCSVRTWSEQIGAISFGVGWHAGHEALIDHTAPHIDAAERLEGVTAIGVDEKRFVNATAEHRPCSPPRSSTWTVTCCTRPTGRRHLGTSPRTRELLAELRDDPPLGPWTRHVAGAAPDDRTTHNGATPMPPSISTVLSLERVDIFSTLRFDVLAELADPVTRSAYAAGTVIIEQVDVGDELFAVVVGAVDVAGLDGTSVRLEQHTVFGELGILDPAPRSATVTGATDVEVLRVSQRTLLASTVRPPTVMAEIACAPARRLRRRVDRPADRIAHPDHHLEPVGARGPQVVVQGDPAAVEQHHHRAPAKSEQSEFATALHCARRRCQQDAPDSGRTDDDDRHSAEGFGFDQDHASVVGPQYVDGAVDRHRRYRVELTGDVDSAVRVPEPVDGPVIAVVIGRGEATDDRCEARWFGAVVEGSHRGAPRVISHRSPVQPEEAPDGVVPRLHHER